MGIGAPLQHENFVRRVPFRESERLSELVTGVNRRSGARGLIMALLSLRTRYTDTT